MKQVLGGPMFAAKEDEYGRSIYKKEGLHYNIYGMNTDVAMKMLKELFPEGKANDLNFVLFSTSGIHGSYCTIEDIEESLIKHRDKKYFDEEAPDDYAGEELTFLIVHPRVVCLKYGNVKVTLDDITFLKTLRDSSKEAIMKIGAK